jgi:hypothetical protein
MMLDGRLGRALACGLASGVAIKTTVVRSVSGGRSAAAAVRPIVGIVFFRSDLRALPKRKADESHQDDKGDKRSYPVWHGPLQRGTLIIE